MKPDSTTENKKQKVENHKEVQEKSSEEDELPQFTPAGMRPLIGYTSLLERVKKVTTKEDITNQNQTRWTTTSNDQEVLPENLNINQENKQETPEQFQEVDFQRVSALERANNSIYLKDDGFLQDKQKQNRVQDFIYVDNLMDHLSEEFEKGQR